MTLGVLERNVGVLDLVRIWIWSWIGNLLGGMLVAALVIGAGVMPPAAEFISSATEAKMTAPGGQLIFRAILCNWLVCLAVWMSLRTKSDAAKCIVIFWSLFAFIACGFEHSVANMTLFSLALFGPHSEAVTWIGFFRNLGWVTFGNIIGGAVLVAGAYWMTAFHYKGENQDG